MTSYDVLISYSRKDRRCADAVERALTSRGVRTWMDRRNNRAGDIWVDELDTAVRNSEIVVLISSPDSNGSQWVRHEIEAALRLNRRIVPFQLGEAVPIEGVAAIVDRRGFHRIVAHPGPTAGDLRALAEDVRTQLDRPVADNIPPYTASAFIGREAYMQRLTKANDRVLLSGISGAGKTEIALQFALRYKRQFKGGIFVANCANADFGSELSIFAESYLRLNIPGLLGPTEKVRWIWLNWNHVGPVLVIINDPHTESLADVLPPRNVQFRVIVCSQEQEILGMEQIPVGLLSQAESMKLLSELIGAARVNAEISAARDICRWSGGLPLALDAIVCYLQRNASDTLASYRDQLTSSGIDQRAFRENPGHTREKTLNRAFELSWMRLSEAGKNLGWILGKLAFAPITKEFLAPLDVEAGWDDLLHWHFLRPLGQAHYEVHHGRLHEFLAARQIQRAPRLMDQLHGALQKRATEVVKSACGVESAMLTAPHLEYVAFDENSRANPATRFLFLNAAAKSYEIQGLHKRVEAAAQRAIAFFGRLSGKDRTAIDRYDLWDLDHRMRVAQISQGWYGRARRGLEALQAETAKQLPRALQYRVWSSLGDASRLLGTLVESANAYQRARTLAQGAAQHSEALYRLARVERLLGNHREAGRLYTEAERSAPKGGRTHAYCMFGIAEVARLNRQYELAGEKYQAALQEFQKIHHKEGEAYALWGTGEIRRWQCDFAGSLRDHEESEQLCLEIGDRRSQVWAIMGMAEAWRAKGDASQSKLQYERALHVLTDSRRAEDREPTELALARLGLAASRRLLGNGSAEHLAFSYGIYRRQNMAYYQVQCLVERALARKPDSSWFKRDLAAAEKICKAKSYKFELDEINRIREHPSATWIHELNPT